MELNRPDIWADAGRVSFMRNLFMEMPTERDVPQMVAASYLPSRVVGLPDWAINDAYDLECEGGSSADLADGHDPTKQPVMLRSMLLAMLQDGSKWWCIVR